MSSDGKNTAVSTSFPSNSISNDPNTFFATLLSSPPQAANAGAYLAGPMASDMRDQSNPQIAALYLQAVARHIAPDNASAGEKYGDKYANQARPRTEEARQRYEILQAVGCAATKCSPRSAISQSGILPVLVRLIGSPHSLCAAHVELMQCCLLAGQYRYARRIIADEWPRPLAGFAAQQVLRYFYYRGMIHMALDEWNMAIRCFWTCVTVPSEVVSAITLSAWKKMVLCHCLVEPVTKPETKGQTAAGASQHQSALPSCLTLPAAASPQVVRFFAVVGSARNSTNNNPDDGTSAAAGGGRNTEQRQNVNYGVRAYFDLVKAFCQGDRARFASVLQDNANVWQSDRNMGMVKRIEKDLLCRHVYHLSRIYSVIPLSQVSFELQLTAEDVRSVLLKLSCKGMTIEIAQDDMVSFPNADRIRDEDLNTGQLMALAERIRRLDVAVATTPRYQQLTRKDKGDSLSRSAAAGPPRGVAEL